MPSKSSRPVTLHMGESALKKPKNVVIAWSDQTPEQRAATIKTLTAKLDALGLHQLQLKASVNHLAPAPGSDQLIDVNESLSLEGFVLSELETKYDEFLGVLHKTVEGVFEEAEQGASVGHPVPVLTAAAPGAAAAPVALGGSVVFLVFWQPNQILAIKKLRALANAHQEWVGKARFVCVSTETEKVNLPNTPIVSHFYTGEVSCVKWGAVDENLVFFLIDANGLLVKRGDPTKFDIVKDVSSCIAGNFAREEKKIAQGQWAALPESSRAELLTTWGQKIKDAGDVDFYLQSTNTTTYNPKGETETEIRLKLTGLLAPEQEKLMAEVLTGLHEGKVDDVSMEAQLLPFDMTGEGDEGDPPAPVLSEKCSECEAVLATASARFLCACCPAPYYSLCGECEAQRATSKHPPWHVLFVVPASGFSSECKFRVGDFTTFPVFPCPSDKPQEVYCDSCEQSIDGVRYDCLECEDEYDLCPTCFGQQKSDGPHINHVWLKLHEPRGCKLPDARAFPAGSEFDDEGDSEDDGNLNLPEGVEEADEE